MWPQQRPDGAQHAGSHPCRGRARREITACLGTTQRRPKHYIMFNAVVLEVQWRASSIRCHVTIVSHWEPSGLTGSLSCMSPKRQTETRTPVCTLNVVFSRHWFSSCAGTVCSDTTQQKHYAYAATTPKISDCIFCNIFLRRTSCLLAAFTRGDDGRVVIPVSFRETASGSLPGHKSHI